MVGRPFYKDSGILRRYHSTRPNGLPVDHCGLRNCSSIPGAVPGNVSSPDVK